MSWRRATKKSFRTLVVVGFAALILSGCYFVDGTVRMSERDGDLIVDVQVTQGVETDLFATSEDAYDYLIQRYSAPDWGYGGTAEAFPFTTVTMRKSVRVESEHNSLKIIQDSNTNSISSNIVVRYVDDGESLPHYVIGFNMNLPTPPEGSDVEQQVTFGLIPPAGWTLDHSPAAGDAIISESTVAWYGIGGGQQFTEYFRLFPIAPVVGEAVAVEPAEPAPVEEADPTPAPSEEQPAEPSDTGGAPAEPNSTTEEESSSGEASAAAEIPDSDELDGLVESAEQASTDIIGLEGRTTTEVSGAPGLVTIDSQLFPAIAMNNQVIPAGSEVAVIGVFTDGLIVEPLTSVESPSFGWLLGGSMTALAAIAAVVFAVLRTRQKNTAPKPEPTEASK